MARRWLEALVSIDSKAIVISTAALKIAKSAQQISRTQRASPDATGGISVRVRHPNINPMANRNCQQNGLKNQLIS